MRSLFTCRVTRLQVLQDLLESAARLAPRSQLPVNMSTVRKLRTPSKRPAPKWRGVRPLQDCFMIIFRGILDKLAHISYEGNQKSDAQAERIPGSWLGKGNHTLFREPAESQDTPLWTPDRRRRGPSHGIFVVFAATGVLILRSALSRYKGAT